MDQRSHAYEMGIACVRARQGDAAVADAVQAAAGITLPRQLYAQVVRGGGEGVARAIDALAKGGSHAA